MTAIEKPELADNRGHDTLAGATKGSGQKHVGTGEGLDAFTSSSDDCAVVNVSSVGVTVGYMGDFTDGEEGVLSRAADEGGWRIMAKKARGVAAASGRRGLAKVAGVGMVAAWRVRVGGRAAIDGTKERAGRALSAAQALVASDLSGDLNQLVAAAVKGTPTVYDKAMDANYLDPALSSGLGGSYHRLFDGGHTIAGAVRAAKGVSADDTVVQEALGTVKALLRDASTPRGLPLATWDKSTFDSVAAALESKFRIPKAWFYELNTYDAADLLGGAIAVVSVIYRWNRADTEEFARLASVIGTSAAVSANPLLVVVSVVAMARAYNKASNADEFAELIDGSFKGAATSGASMAAIAVAGSAGASAGVALLVGVTAGVLAYKVSDKVSLVAVARFAKDQATVLLDGAKGALPDP